MQNGWEWTIGRGEISIWTLIIIFQVKIQKWGQNLKKRVLGISVFTQQFCITDNLSIYLSNRQTKHLATILLALWYGIVYHLHVI